MPTPDQYLQSIVEQAAKLRQDLLKNPQLDLQAPLFVDDLKRVDQMLGEIQEAIGDAAAEAAAAGR